MCTVAACFTGSAHELAQQRRLVGLNQQSLPARKPMPLYKLRRDDSWILLQQALPVLPRSAEERRAPVRR
jgi:hypothetical protein